MTLIPNEEVSARTALMIGSEGVQKLQGAHVVIAGLGGVGGHCAEALARVGIGRLTLIDADTVSPSNLNRQAFATRSTIGMKKTEAAALRLRDISDAELTLIDTFLLPETIEGTLPADADAVADCIDSVPAKIGLAVWGKTHGVPVVASMGAGNRMDPSAFSVRDIYETSGCPLARKLRHELRKAGIEKLDVIVSSEEAKKLPAGSPIGSIAPVPAAAGLVLAAAIIRKLLERS